MKTKQTQLVFRWRVMLLLVVVTAVSCLIIFWRYLIGGEPIAFIDIGSDTQELYLPQYAGIINQLRHGDLSLWNWRDGFGVNMYLFNLTNPFLMVVYLIGFLLGTEATIHAMVWIYVAEILLAVLLCYLYLSLFHFTETAKAIAAYSYGFSGFMMVWAQHYQFGACAVLLPLFLISVEIFLRSGRKFSVFLVIMSAVVVINSFYTGYMTLLAAAFYVIMRVWKMNGPGKGAFGRWLGKCVISALNMILGVGLSGVALLPSAMAVSNVSSRLDSNTYFANLTLSQRILQAFKTPLPKLYYKTLVFRMFSSTSLGIADGVTDYHGYANYYEGPCFFFGTLLLVAAVQYIFLLPKSSKSRKGKIIDLLTAACAVISLGYAAVGVMMDGFSGLIFRYSFLVMPYFALVTARTLTWIIRDKRISIVGLVLSALGICAGYFRMYQACYDPKNNPHLLVLWVTGLLMAAVLLILSQKNDSDRQKSASGVGIKRALCCVLMALVAVNMVSDGRSNFAYRHTIAERDYIKTLYDPDTLKAIRTIKDSDKSFYRIEKMRSATHSMDSMAEDYAPASCYNSTMNGNVLEYLHKYWPECTYKDPNHVQFALGAKNKEANRLLGVKYVLLTKKKATVPGYSFWKQIGHVTILKSDETESIASFYQEGRFTMEKLSGRETDAFARKIGVRFDDRESPEETKILIRYPRPSGRVKARVTTKDDGVLFLAIPYEKGWAARLDGKAACRMLANEGFTAVPVSKGTHEVELIYHCPGLREGAALSMGSLAVLIFIAAVSGHRRRKKA